MPTRTGLLLVSGLSAVLPLVHGYVPLVDKRYTWPNLPFKVDTDVGLPRGTQLGYNICNGTTEGPTSLCQTAFINSLDDFCFWAPAEPGHTVGEIEGEMIAWCTKPGHGTRVMPAGTITGVQFMRTPDYVQVYGFMDQSKVNMVKGDAGGEMDPHGADLRGNPMGGLLFSNAFTGNVDQVVEWHNFMGSDMFCLKACDARGRDDDQFCQHIFDTQGCGFNAPSNARNGVFESCAGDNQAFPGAANPVVPASSLCSSFESTAIYGGGVTVPVAEVTIPPHGVTTLIKPTSTTSTSTSTSTGSGTSSPGTGTSTVSLGTGANAAGGSVSGTANGTSRGNGSGTGTNTGAGPANTGTGQGDSTKPNGNTSSAMSVVAGLSRHLLVGVVGAGAAVFLL